MDDDVDHTHVDKDFDDTHRRDDEDDTQTRRRVCVVDFYVVCVVVFV